MAEPLRDTLASLIDVELLNAGRPRVTVGAVNACTGAMRYFDSRERRLGLDHVMSSGALPPAFPAVRVDGAPYWDGGIYSNTPVEVVLDDAPRRSSIIFSVQMWNPVGPEPQSIWQVSERQKDIQYASRTDGNIARQQQIHRLRHVINELVMRVPEPERASADVQALAAWGCQTTMRVIKLAAPRLDGGRSVEGHRFHAGRDRRAPPGRFRRDDAGDRRAAVGTADGSDRGLERVEPGRKPDRRTAQLTRAARRRRVVPPAARARAAAQSARTMPPSTRRFCPVM